MRDGTQAGAPSEQQVAALVDMLAADPDRRHELTDLLREDHAFYDQRSTTAISRMRGWILLALARTALPETALVFVLEELSTGVDVYLVAAAARALRSHPAPAASFAPFVMRALTNVRNRDEPVSLDSYGDYAVRDTGTSAVRELLATLAWLGPRARDVLPEVEALRAHRGGLFSRTLRLDVDRAVVAIRAADLADTPAPDACCGVPASIGMSSWMRDSRHDSETVDRTVFEDHAGASVTFPEFFRGHASIVVFFYTRCGNPLKCSLTITKLARVQNLLATRGLDDRVYTAAITYDPGFDLPERLRRYSQDRGMRLDARHRMLRTTDGLEPLRRHFNLGVNFIESLVNRHRIEAYILDAEGRVARSFERISWDEQQLVDHAVQVMNEDRNDATVTNAPKSVCCHRAVSNTGG